MTKNRNLNPHLTINHKSNSWDHYLGRLSPDDWESLETLVAKHAPELEKIYGLASESVELELPEKVSYHAGDSHYFRIGLSGAFTHTGMRITLCKLYPMRGGVVGSIHHGPVFTKTLFELPQFSSAFLALNWSIQALLGQVEWRTELDLIPATGEDEQNGAPD